jgi:hypothetical protein
MYKFSKPNVHYFHSSNSNCLFLLQSYTGSLTVFKRFYNTNYNTVGFLLQNGLILLIFAQKLKQLNYLCLYPVKKLNTN